MSSQPSSSTRNLPQSDAMNRLDVVPDYENLLILDKSDESLFEHVDLEQQNQHQDSQHSLSAFPHPRSRSSTGNSPSSTIMKGSNNILSTRQPLQDGTNNRERQASNSLAPAPVRLAQAQVSLSWTDILRPLMDDDSHRLDTITAPLGVQNQPQQTAALSSGQDKPQDLSSSGNSKLSASAPASRAGTIRRERSRSPNRDRAHSHATQQPPSTVLGVLADGRVASPKVSTRRERSPSTSPSPDTSMTQTTQTMPIPKAFVQQQPQNSTQTQQQQQQQSGALTLESRTQVSTALDREQYQQSQMPANINTAKSSSTQNSLLQTNNNSTPPSPTSSRRDYSKEIQPKVDTWRVESPTARRRAQEAAEREAQRQREEQAQREMEEFHRQQLERMREAERRRKVDVETHVCSLDFLVSVGTEEKQPVEPPSPTVKQVQPKVDTWWREGRPRSPTMERANRPQLAILSNDQQQQQAAASPATSESGAQAGASTTSPSRTRKTWGTTAAPGVGTKSPVSSNTNRNAPIDADSEARQQPSPKPAVNQQQQQHQQQTQSQSGRQQQQPQQVLQRPPSPQQSRQSLARPPSPTQSRSVMPNNLTVNVNHASDESNSTSPPSPNRKPRSPRPTNLTIETTQHPTLSRQAAQQQAASSPKSASLSRASARKVASQLSETLDSAVVASASSPTTRTSPSRSRTTSANPTTTQLDESHGPTRAFLQQQSQHILNDQVAPPSPTTSSSKRQLSSTLLVPQSPGGTMQRSRKSSSASASNVSFAADGSAGAAAASMLRKQQRELGTVTNMGAAGGPPAVLTLQARSWRSYLMREGAYVALLAVFLLLAFDTLAGDYGHGYKVGCVKIARHLSNTGEVVCHD
ncbi:hypothetical protein BCR44DRAFT_1495738 [Catenaria anguillulae PL171]|uniref:Uncharacterized protein n=1 Tax=Catenaria anguillulae PL171 TaxID=765915 RepID=A0A1Y2I0F4_9FUNG|nr:hypothetical protein BCR44DRAFT_1495738 [Catenaria anguillulae PL171]